MTSQNPIITHIITDLAPGGAETFLLRLISSLDCFCHHVISLTPLEDAHFADLFREKAASVTSLNISPKNLLSAYKLFQLWKILKRQSPNLVQTWMYHGNILGGIFAKINKIPLIWNIRNSSLDKETPEVLKLNTLTNYLVKMGARLSNSIPNAIIFCSYAAASLHQKWGYNEKKSLVIQNGIDPEQFFPQPQLKLILRKKLNIENAKNVIGFVGRFHTQKDIPNLLKAASLFLKQESNTHFVFCGNELTNENPLLNQWIKNEGVSDNCHLLGKIHDTYEIYNAFDISCLTSSYGEAFPNVIAESMACGIPCVGTDVGDTRMIIGDQGITVPPKNPQVLAQAWKDLLTKQKDPKTIRQRILDNFTLASSKEAYRRLYFDQITKIS